MITKDRKKEEQADEYSIYKVKAYASYKLVRSSLSKKVQQEILKK